MRRKSVMRGLLAVGLLIVLGLSRGAANAASTLHFGGGWEDHFWDVQATFCKDGFKIEAHELEHPDEHGNPGGRGDDKPYMLVITTTAPLITDDMPAIIGSWAGGPNHELASATAYYAYTEPQLATAPISITLERWDHGDHSTVDTGEESPGDDRGSISGQIINCTVLTPPVFDVPPSPKDGAAFFVQPGEPLAFPVEGSDADGIDVVTLGVANLPAGASFAIPPAANPAAATFSWTPTANQRGSYTVQFSATDASGRSAPLKTVTIHVGPKLFLPLTRK